MKAKDEASQKKNDDLVKERRKSVKFKADVDDDDRTWQDDEIKKLE